MEKDYGEPLRHDPDFSGPVRRRSCTDVVWLIIFILFLGGWGYLGYYGVKNGDVERLLAPLDSRGKRCGLDSGLENKKYLMFFNIAKCLSPTTAITGCPTRQVCVEKCPEETIQFGKDGYTASNFNSWKSRMVCIEELNINTMTYTDAMKYISEEKCAPYLVKSKPVLFRCIGDLSTLPCSGNAAQETVAPEACRNPKAVEQALREKATALDSYVGWIAASWVTYFTHGDERDAHIVVLGRCFIDIKEALSTIEDFAHFSEEEAINNLLNIMKLNELASQIAQDLVLSRWYLAGALAAVVLVCFIYILVLRWVITPLVWASIVGLLAVLSFSCYLCFKQYQYYKDKPSGLYQTSWSLKGTAENFLSKHQTWLALVIILAIILLILTLIVIFLRTRITIAIALIREGSKAVIDIKSTVFFPIFPWLVQCFVIAYGLFVLVHLLSIGEPAFRVVEMQNDTCDCGGLYKDQDPCNPSLFMEKCHEIGSAWKPCAKATCHFTGLDSSYGIMAMHLANLLGFFWAMFFISGVSDMILANTFATWYWTFDKRKVPFWTLTTGISTVLCYHLGTVAFGALIIAIVRVIRVILEYIDQKLKKFDNPFTRCLLCCCKCFFWCLENFIKFINKNAYIMCAVHGKNFCSSARDAFSLLMRNIIRVVVLDKVTDFIFFLSKMLLSIGVGFAVFYLLEWSFVYEVTQGGRLHYNYVPAVVLGIATYLISSIFFSVYGMAVDTLFLCFLEDCERNDGSSEKKFYMSKDLMKILGKRNKKD